MNSHQGFWWDWHETGECSPTRRAGGSRPDLCVFSLEGKALPRRGKFSTIIDPEQHELELHGSTYIPPTCGRFSVNTYSPVNVFSLPYDLLTTFFFSSL